MERNSIKIIIAFCLILLGSSSFAMSNKSNATKCQDLVGDKLCREIGQMLIVGFGGFDQNRSGKIIYNDTDSLEFKKQSAIGRDIADQHVGGVLLYTRGWRDIKTKKFIRDRNIQTPEQVAKLNLDLQNFNAKIRAEQKLQKLPLFICLDQEGGMVDRMPTELGFPVKTLLPMALGAKEEVNFKNPKKRQAAIKETYIYAQNLAKEIHAMNFNVSFSPVLDVNVNPMNPDLGGRGRSFSNNEYVVADQAKQFIRAFQGNEVIPVLKHFPGHGSATTNPHLGLVDVTDTYQMTKELYAYQEIVKNGYLGMIMTTHGINGQLDQTQCKAGILRDHTTWCPGTMSHKILTDLLRGKIGYNGLIISDDMTMGAIANEYPLEYALEKAINAGVNIFIIANNYDDQTEKMIDTIAQLVKDGKVSRQKIDDAYIRIAQFKQKHL